MHVCNEIKIIIGYTLMTSLFRPLNIDNDLTAKLYRVYHVLVYIYMILIKPCTFAHVISHLRFTT